MEAGARHPRRFPSASVGWWLDDPRREYLRSTVEAIGRIAKLFRTELREVEKLRAELPQGRTKKTKKFLRLRRRLARARFEIAKEIKHLNLTEIARLSLIESIGLVYREVRGIERETERLNERLARKRTKPEEEKELKRQIAAAKRRLS